MTIILRRPRTSQPTTFLVNSLHFAAPRNFGEGLWVPGVSKSNLYGSAQAIGTSSSTATDYGQYGNGISGTFNGTTEALDTGISNVASANGVTVACLVNGSVEGAISSSDANASPFSSGAFGVSWLNISPYNSSFYIRGTGSYPNAKFLASGSNLQANTWYFLVGVAESGRLAAYANGVLGGTTSAGWGTGADFGNLFIGRHQTKAFWGGRVAFCLKLNRALSHQQIVELSRNPWQLFAPRRIIIPVGAAAATAPTLSDLRAINVGATSTQWSIDYTF